MKKNIVICLVFCIPIAMFAAEVGVLNFKAGVMEKETAQAIAALIASELTSYGHNVKNPDAMNAAVGEEIKCYESGCAAEVGFKAGVERVIFGSVSKFGEKYIVQASVVKVATRQTIWSGSLSAATAEELDIVAKRIAKAIAEGKKVEAGVEIGTITEEERTLEARRKKSFYATGGNFGYTLPLGGYADATSLMGFTWINWYETPNFAVAFNGIYHWSLGAATWEQNESVVIEYGGDICFYYMFSKSDISPYLGGGVGPRFLMLTAGFYSSGANFGMSFNGGGGIVLLRTYDFHVIADARYIINIADLPDFQGPHHGFDFGLGVVYRPRKKQGCGGGGCMGGGCF
ncbi:MAG TPA: hypothetical protein ENI34_08830 [candidate division WOR-3 bacterium]|uniref:Uncharacterized protein n=1 Tax=candidate division WOR-3 bacterium TaxID=2052148 RepID=A0A9C9K0M4_UNCW3|nr:hypothetical protein [candidate division WOR-3 bacterium]